MKSALIHLAGSGSRSKARGIDGDSHVQVINVVLPDIQLSIHEVGVDRVNEGGGVDDVVTGLLLVVGDGEGGDGKGVAVVYVQVGRAKTGDHALVGVGGPVVGSLQREWMKGGVRKSAV